MTREAGPEDPRRKVADPSEGHEPTGIGFLLRTVAVLVGGFLFLAGATNLAAMLLFDSPAFPDDDSLGLGTTEWVVASVVVAGLGALIAGAPLARATREMLAVRRRENELPDGEE